MPAIKCLAIKQDNFTCHVNIVEPWTIKQTPVHKQKYVPHAKLICSLLTNIKGQEKDYSSYKSDDPS